MTIYSAEQFSDTVMQDFQRRRLNSGITARSTSGPALVETKALGHPDFEDLDVGQRRTASVVAVFLDLTDFTGRSFWDDENEVADLAHAVLTGFVEVVSAFGGFPLGLRGDGLFAGFGPGDPRIAAVCALGACAFALNAVENGVNRRLDAVGIHRVQARAGLDYGRITFVRTGSRERNEVNPIGFAANFAAKCEKKAKSWEIVIGEGIAKQLPDVTTFVEHLDSPKEYQRDYKSRYYRFYDYRWRKTLPLLPMAIQQINGNPTSRIAIG